MSTISKTVVSYISSVLIVSVRTTNSVPLIPSQEKNKFCACVGGREGVLITFVKTNTFFEISSCFNSFLNLFS